MPHSLRTISAAALMASLLLAGCRDESPQIEQYTIPKDRDVFEANHVGDATYPGDEAANRATPTRTAAPRKAELQVAMIIDGPATWFFKYQGPPEDLSLEKYAEFLNSIHFRDGEPQWKLPEGWSQLPDDDPRNRGFVPRYATILTGGDDDAVEVAVTKLPTGTQPREEYILINVNRWRKLLGLKPTTAGKLYRTATGDAKNGGRIEEVVKRNIDGRTAVLVHLTGTLQPKGRPPFMGR